MRAKRNSVGTFAKTASGCMAALFLAACASVSYQGETRPETRYVKVFTNSFFVKDNYQPMGTGSYLAREGEKGTEVNEVLLKKCREIGADAVLIEAVGDHSAPQDNDTSVAKDAAKAKTEGDKKSCGKDVPLPLVMKADTLVRVSFHKQTPPAPESVLEKKKADVNMDQLLDSQATKGSSKVDELLEKQAEKDKKASPNGDKKLNMEKIPDNVNKTN